MVRQLSVTALAAVLTVNLGCATKDDLQEEVEKARSCGPSDTCQLFKGGSCACGTAVNAKDVQRLEDLADELTCLGSMSCPACPAPTCLDGRCVCEIPCTESAQCPAGASCRSKICVSCGDCGIDSRCLAGRCVLIACGSTSCPEGSGCQDGVCVEERCLDVACPAEEVCTGGVCGRKTYNVR